MKMTGVMAAFLLLASLARSCNEVKEVLVCREIPSNFELGFSTLLLLQNNMGELNSSALQSDSLASVSELVISGAGLTGMAPGALASFVRLEALRLPDNALSRVSAGWLGSPPVLRELDLAGNRIRVLTGSTLEGLPGLTKLNLSGNGLRQLHPGSLAAQGGLLELDLSGNRLTGVPPPLLGGLGALRAIRLDGNPWNCSCGPDQEAFLASVKELKSRSQLDRAMAVTCETPPALKGQPVWSVSACPGSPTPAPPTGDPPTPPASPEALGTSSTLQTPAAAHQNAAAGAVPSQTCLLVSVIGTLAFYSDPTSGRSISLWLQSAGRLGLMSNSSHIQVGH
ncbi:uncharacterized protein ACNS7B_011742 [Menidia menidia]